LKESSKNQLFLKYNYKDEAKKEELNNYLSEEIWSMVHSVPARDHYLHYLYTKGFNSKEHHLRHELKTQFVKEL
jgi:hypothetical protein